MKTGARERSGRFTSKDGFSVVAPIRMIVPSSTWGRKASCWLLLKRWISSQKRIVRRPLAASRSRASPMTPANPGDALRHRGERHEGGVAPSARSRARVVFPLPGGPQKMQLDSAPPSNIRPSARSGPRRCGWPRTSPRLRGLMRAASGRCESSAALAKRSALSVTRRLRSAAGRRPALRRARLPGRRARAPRARGEPLSQAHRARSATGRRGSSRGGIRGALRSAAPA